MLLPLYPCSQAVLVLVVTTALDSMEEYLDQFTNFKSRYTQAWIDNVRAMLAAAEALPDEAARRAASEIIRVVLLEQNIECCALWQKLKRYIMDSFASNIVNIQLAAAGQDKYKMAYDKNWAEAKAMHVSAKNFMTDKLTDLTADGNMPATFPAIYNDAADVFNAKLTAYEASKEAIPVATEAKTAAFNAVYQKLMSMLLDGQEIFKDNEVVRTQFVFSHIEERVSGHGLAGARGTVVNALTDLPIAKAKVLLVNATNPADTHSAPTDDEGKYLIHCPSGDYILKITAEGYKPSSAKNISIEVGTVSKFSEKLTPLNGGS